MLAVDVFPLGWEMGCGSVDPGEPQDPSEPSSAAGWCDGASDLGDHDDVPEDRSNGSEDGGR